MKGSDPPHDYLQKPSRRRILTLSAGVLATGLAGCSGGGDSGQPDTPPTDTPAETETPTETTPDSDVKTDTAQQTDEEMATPGILIEYSLSDPRTHEEVPEKIVEHPNPENFLWVVVEFEVVSGSFDVSDIIGLTQLRAGGTEHFTRAVVMTSPDEETFTSSNDEYMIAGRTRGKAYYRISEEPANPEWVVEQLRNQHGSVEIRQN